MILRQKGWRGLLGEVVAKGLIVIGLLISLGQSTIAEAQTAPASHWDETAPAGGNYETAAFRLWLPPGEGPVRALVVLSPGSNMDGRGEVDKPAWQEFATREHLALVGVYFTDKPPVGFIEQYADVRRGSGEALLNAIAALGARAGHAELAKAPLLLWGMSAGGEVNYELAAWKPERVAAFVVNKGGVYYSGILGQASRNTPGLFFTGEVDRASRTAIVTGLFLMNRRAGALWAFAQEKGLGHEVGRSPGLAIIFFSEVLAQRLPPDGVGPLRVLSPDQGFIGDIRTGDYHPAKAGERPDETTAWLPTQKAAEAWAELVRAPAVAR